MNETNNEVLLKYLQEGNIVTTRTAPEKIGIADVRANIRDLRDAEIAVKEKWKDANTVKIGKINIQEYKQP